MQYLHIVTHQYEGQAPITGANTWDIIKTRLLAMLGRMLNRRQIPGTIQPMSYDDPLTGDRITVVVNPLFTVLSVNTRDYYFHRLTGRFDGTGTGCSANPPFDCTLDNIPE